MPHKNVLLGDKVGQLGKQQEPFKANAFLATVDKTAHEKHIHKKMQLQ